MFGKITSKRCFKEQIVCLPRPFQRLQEVARGALTMRDVQPLLQARVGEVEPDGYLVLFLGFDEGDQFLDGLAILLEFLQGFAFDNPHLNEDQTQEIVSTCFHKGFGGHVTSVSHSEFKKPLDEVFDRFSFFLFGDKESVHINVYLLLEEAAEEESLQVIPACDGAFGKLAEPFKGYSLEGANERPGPDGIVPY